MRLANPNIRGVVVSAVDPNSDAGTKGLQQGDVILSIDRQPTTTPEQAAAAVENARRAGRNVVLLLLQRAAQPPLYVGIELAPAR